MTHATKRSLVALAGLAALGCIAVVSLAAAAPAPKSAPDPAAPAAAPAATPAAKAPPFARVYLATRGCSSCAHCRTSIRQMLGPETKGAETSFGDDQIEVSYPAPRTIPLREVIQRLAQNRLHDLTLVDVLFDATGVIRTSRTGLVTFEVAETGQPFTLTLDPAVTRPADGTAVRLTAVVEGWRDKGALSLRARDLRAKS